MSLQKAIAAVQLAAQAEDGGDQGKHSELLDKIHKLQLVAEKPDESAMRLRWQFMALFAIRFAIEYGVLQAISEKAGEQVTAAELAQKTGAEELLIVRTMRLVTYNDVCDEMRHGVYAANERTRFFATPAISGGFAHVFHFGFGTTHMVPELIREGKLCQFPKTPEERSPIQHAFGDSMFSILSKEPRRKKIFDDYMEARRYSKEPKWFEIFPAGSMFSGELKAKSQEHLLVDVGGGKGHDIASFRKSFPSLKGILTLQDLPHTFASLVEKPTGVELMEHDFFREQPVKGKLLAVDPTLHRRLTVTGARAYFLHNILHDWADDQCISILKNIATAMDAEKSRILLEEFVVPETEVDWLTASLDLCMWLFFSGMERTMPQWRKLFDAARLEVVQVWSTQASKNSVIELRVQQ